MLEDQLTDSPPRSAYISKLLVRRICCKIKALLIVRLILLTCNFDSVVILQGEIGCCSLLALNVLLAADTAAVAML